jgi:5-methylcytosine-specific restriction endonuclease McrA
MSRQRIPEALKTAVRERASGCCEYCRMPEAGAFFAHEADHVIATQHRGQTDLDNLALACVQCNRFKGPNITSVDPETHRIVPLFNPRTILGRNIFGLKAGKLFHSHPWLGRLPRY